MSLSQGNQTSSVYYTKFRSLVDELENLNLIPKCTCTCTCGTAILQAKNEIIMRVSQFLMGLNPQFSAVKGQILLMLVFPTLNEAYALLLQEEEQRSCVVLPIEPSVSNSTAFYWLT